MPKTPSNSFNAGKQDKDNNRNTQVKTILAFLYTRIATGSMVASATGIPQKNFTRYKRDLEKNGMLWEVEKKPCKLTGFKAWYVTCNPKLAVSR